MCTSGASLSAEPQCRAVQQQWHTAPVQQQDEVLPSVSVRVRVPGRAERRQCRAGTQEKMGRNIRDGIIKAGPAIEVLGSAKALGK
ncbi:hypothetical protein HW555_009790 [Spodoptera exigua]|uniref:Uncharacterized protein n=1 Tax=Spodoptera exigua TaxID=7107 RepID=A0A835L0F2_SPOEX|nr:hypothetical protein HW555_009790 [Spodoptera exigua]